MRVPFILMLAATVAALCILALGHLTGASAESPDGPGPHNVGFYYDYVNTSTKEYVTPVLVYYPAYDAGENARPDPGSGPYPAVVFLPFFGGDRLACSDMTNRLASWGFIVLAVSVNWGDFPNSGGPEDIDDLLDYLEEQDGNSSSPLDGMLASPHYGISGYSSGGGLALYSGGQVDRVAAVLTFAAAVGVGTVDALVPLYDKPVQLQIGQDDADYIAGSRRAFQKFTCTRSLVEILHRGHGGPFNMGLFAAFYLYHLQGVCGMLDYVYGRNAVEGAANGQYDLYFNITSGTYFPPTVSSSAKVTDVLMDEPCELKGSIAGFFPANHEMGAFEWDFNNDGYWDASHPTIMETIREFSAPGTYEVRFSYKLGRLRYLAPRTISVRVSNVPPTAVASGDATVDQDGTATFHSYGSSDTPSDQKRLEFSWDFGDDATSEWDSSPIVAHLYTARDTFAVTLTVRDPWGGTATAGLFTEVLDVAPTVEAGANLEAVEDSPVALAAEGNDTPSDIATLWYRWDLGDGQGTDWSARPGVEHAYAAATTYVATVTVRDSARETAKDTLTVIVHNVPPTCLVDTPASRSTVPMDETVRFRGAWTDTPSDIDGIRCRWDFGDGDLTEWDRTTSATVTHRYTAPGPCTVTFSAIDSDGARADHSVDITVLNLAPVATVVRPNDWATAAEGTSMVLEGAADDTASDLQTLVVEWVVDGAVHPGPRAVVAFNTSGVHVAVLRATDQHGAVGEAWLNITVRNVAPTLTATVGPLEVLVGDRVDMAAWGDDTRGDLATLKVEWDLGDGNASSAWSLEHNFTRAGVYRVTVTVADDDNETVTMAFTMTVSERPAPPTPPSPPPPEVDGPYLELSGGMLVGIGITIALVATVVVLLVTRQRGRESG